MRNLLLSLSLLCWMGASQAAHFAPVFSSGMVLQRDLPIHVWGGGTDGEEVTLEISQDGTLVQTATTHVMGGKWAAALAPLPAKDGLTFVLKGYDQSILTDVSIGEVWLCTGQSNMEWRMHQCSPLYDELLAKADNPRIRQVKIPLRAYSGDKLPAFTWKTFKAPDADKFGAVSYFFAEKLQQELGVTIGLVNCSYGGTRVEAWMSLEAIKAAGQQEMVDEHFRKIAAFPSVEAYETEFQQWKEAKASWDARKKAGESTESLGTAPVEPYGFRSNKFLQSLRDSMLSLVTPYSARGFIWYQGESNAGSPQAYGPLLKEFIKSCRTDWSNPSMPFYIAQIANPGSSQKDEHDAYAKIREIQREIAVADPNSGFIVTLDQGERGNVHPPFKKAVGERFARLALSRVYGKTGFSGQSPHAVKALHKDGVIEISFASLSGTLAISGDSIPTLEVGADQFVEAKGRLGEDRKTLIVEIPEGVKHVEKVRYGWRNYCKMSLFTDEGLPVSQWSLPVTHN